MLLKARESSGAGGLTKKNHMFVGRGENETGLCGIVIPPPKGQGVRVSATTRASLEDPSRGGTACLPSLCPPARDSSVISTIHPLGAIRQ